MTTKMGGNTCAKNQNHKQQQRSIDVHVPSQTGSKCFDEDVCLKRIGTVNTANAHIITAVIGSGVLSSAWAIAQLGWIAGPTVMLFFSFVTYYTSTLLAACYGSCDLAPGERNHTCDLVPGKTNHTYMDAVQSNFGGVKVKVCGLIWYLNRFGDVIGYTIASSMSMRAIKRSNCFHASGGRNPCRISSNPYMIAFGVAEIVFSQIPDFDQIWWLSIVAAVMTFTYSTIGLGLGIAKVAEIGNFKGSLTGIRIGTVTEAQKIWRALQALGDITFACSYSIILVEIQDTVRSPPTESKTMKKASLISVSVTIFYMLCGCFGYAAFGDLSPGNLLTGFGFYNPYWLLDIANAAIVIHLVGAYQVSCQQLFAFVEKQATEWFPGNDFISKEIDIPIPGIKPYKLNLFRLVWRPIFVIVTTIISMLMPFFNDVVGILGGFGFWPLTVYIPVEMYIVQKEIPKWTTRWLCLQILSLACLVISIAAASGSIAGIVLDHKS